MATSAAAAVQDEPATKFAKDQLKAIIERIERLEEEKKTISDDIRDVYGEAKGNGFDVKVLRTIVRFELGRGRRRPHCLCHAASSLVRASTPYSRAALPHRIACTSSS